MRFKSVNLVSWLGLDRDLPKLRKFSRILILREPLVTTGWKLGILCLQINLFVGLLVGVSSGYGCESRDGRFHGGTIYNDATSGLIWVENQVSLGASETIMGKERFEQWLYDTACVEVKHFHGNNGIFSSEE